MITSGHSLHSQDFETVCSATAFRRAFENTSKIPLLRKAVATSRSVGTQRLFCRRFWRQHFRRLHALPLAGLIAIQVARHLQALRRMIFIHLRTVGQTKTVFLGLIARLLQQIGIPKGSHAMPVKMPCRKRARRQIVRPSGNGHKDRLGGGNNYGFNVAVRENPFAQKMIDASGQGHGSVPRRPGIDSHGRRSAQSEIYYHCVNSGRATEFQQPVILAHGRNTRDQLGQATIGFL